MTHLAWPKKGLHHFPAHLSGARSAYAPMRPILLYGGIVSPEMCNDIISAGKRKADPKQ